MRYREQGEISEEASQSVDRLAGQDRAGQDRAGQDRTRQGM